MPHDEIDFGIKVLKYARSSFERQIYESVMIQANRMHNLLNSKSEYNRSAVPRLLIKLGENEFKVRKKEEEAETKKDEMLEAKIRQLRKNRNKQRNTNYLRGQPSRKKIKFARDEEYEKKSR